MKKIKIQTLIIAILIVLSFKPIHFGAVHPMSEDPLSHTCHILAEFMYEHNKFPNSIVISEHGKQSEVYLAFMVSGLNCCEYSQKFKPYAYYLIDGKWYRTPENLNDKNLFKYLVKRSEFKNVCKDVVDSSEVSNAVINDPTALVTFINDDSKINKLSVLTINANLIMDQYRLIDKLHM